MTAIAAVAAIITAIAIFCVAGIAYLAYHMKRDHYMVSSRRDLKDHRKD